MTCSGITFRSREMTILEQISTNMVDKPMPMPLNAAVVTASVGHIPSSPTSVGFSFRIPFVNSFP